MRIKSKGIIFLIAIHGLLAVFFLFAVIGPLFQHDIFDYQSFIQFGSLILSIIGLLKLKRWGLFISVILIPLIVGFWILPLWVFLATFLPDEIQKNIWSSFKSLGPNIVLIGSIVFTYLIYIYFFTRPKIKGQFS